MNSTASKATTATRFTVSRAQFSPLGRRTSALSSPRSLTNSVRLLTRTNTRTLPSSVVASEATVLPPNFWSSGDLARLQPEITRYHD